jgi:hypothetical protein
LTADDIAARPVLVSRRDLLHPDLTVDELTGLLDAIA